jgi:hypothetical protein
MSLISKKIFDNYFKRKLFWGFGIGLFAVLIRLARGYETSVLFSVIFLLVFIALAFAIGYIDYNFYEREAPKIIEQLLDKEPLVNFKKIGFKNYEDNKLNGTIHNYRITLAPLTNLQKNKVLTILIPLQIREGLDNYFLRYDEVFKFSLTDEVLFAQAVLKEYDQKFDYDELFSLIDKTVLSLKKNQIAPLEIIGE